ncbi:MAG: hypothetical protein ACXWF0_11535 [Usitatibacter sp.]
MSRTLRRFAALVAAAALAFSQLAVSAFACPHESVPAITQAAPEHADDGCDSAMNPNLCERHCDYGSSSVASPAQALPALAPAQLPWRFEPLAVVEVSRLAVERLTLASHPPPPFILLGVLRI